MKKEDYVLMTTLVQEKVGDIISGLSTETNHKINCISGNNGSPSEEIKTLIRNTQQ